MADILQKLQDAYHRNPAEAYNLLPDLMDAIGKTVFETPCEVGDTVYVPSYDCTHHLRYNPFDKHGTSYAETCLKCKKWPCDLHKQVIEKKAESLQWIFDNTVAQRFGETVFLTPKEAEQELERRKE